MLDESKKKKREREREREKKQTKRRPVRIYMEWFEGGTFQWLDLI
jgi:hypothetical protein